MPTGVVRDGGGGESVNDDVFVYLQICLLMITIVW